MDHLQAASEALDDILNPYDLRRHLADYFADVMFDGEEDEDSEEEEEEDEDENEEEEDEEDDDDDGKPPAGKGRRRGRTEDQLRKEAARRRVENKQLKADLAKVQADLKKFTDKDKSKGEKAETDLAAERERADKAEAKLTKLARKSAVRDLADDHGVKDVSYFTFLLDEADIELDDDGEWPDDVDKQVKKLVKKHKAQLNGGAAEGEDEDEEDEGPPRVGPTGRAPRRKGRTGAQRHKELSEKYPALAGRVR